MSRNIRLKRERKQRRVRRKSLKIRSHAQPYLRVRRTNKHFYAEIVQPSSPLLPGLSDRILIAASTLEFENQPTSNIDAATKLGEVIVKRGIDAGFKELSFDTFGC